MDGLAKKVFVVKTDENLLRGPFLVTDLYENLRQTNGSVTWRELEDRMENIVFHETIRSHIKSIETFTYHAGRIFPILDSQAEQRRIHWAKAFWVFWEIAKAMKKKKQIMLVHMDER